MSEQPTSSVDADLAMLAAQIPPRGERNLAVRVSKDAERWLRNDSPWLYDGSIESISFEGQPGDLAVVFDHDREFLAVGLYDPDSPIRVKLLQARTPVTIDGQFWRQRLSTALEQRRSLIDATGETTGYRLVNGENDRFPGLIIDRYADTAVIKLYTAAWFVHLAAVVAELVALSGVSRVVLRLSRHVAGGDTFGYSDGAVIVGTEPQDLIEFRERGITLFADVVSGQKTGHFLDQRDNRALVRGATAEARVLDMFASTGGFALAAAAGGAQQVHLSDLSAPALDTARRNIAANQTLVAGTEFSFEVGDAFVVLDQLARANRQFDVVIVDPPSFAQNQAAVAGALRSYRRLTEKSLRVLAPGGMLVQSSCSSRVTSDEFFDTVHAAGRAGGRSLREIRRTAHPVDHPVGFQHGAYLKTLFAVIP